MIEWAKRRWLSNLIFLALLLLFGVWTHNSARKTDDIIRNGDLAEGQIVATEQKRVRRRNQYFAAYRYERPIQPDGAIRTVKGRSEISRRAYDALKREDRVLVRYQWRDNVWHSRLPEHKAYPLFGQDHWKYVIFALAATVIYNLVMEVRGFMKTLKSERKS